MELFHNQVTREQGLFSLRFNHESFGLHFIAENVGVPVKVLDFPSEKRFVREISKGYDIVGISFITPNFVKARHMARLVRQHAPKSRIVLGGHGTAIPGVEDMIPHDHICKGEGVQWFRRLLGEDTDRPYRHPALLSGFSKRVFGVPMPTDAAVLIPGVGCPNACRFCATSHFFDKTYTPFFDSGRELYDLCRRIEARLGCRDFFVMDENFLKRPERAQELMRLMEENQNFYRFSIFSSAETVTALGPDFLARLGVNFIWIGVESKREVYEKNRGVDLKAMIRALRDRGIGVLASGILFLEHHDPESIWDDIRFVVDLESDFVQFMQLGPMPDTRLFREYDAAGLLRKDVPFEEWHGQHRIWFDHPRFSPEDSERILREAFRFDFDTQGSSVLRLCETALRGTRTLTASPDPVLRERGRFFHSYAQGLRPALRVLKRHGHTDTVRAMAETLARDYKATFGPETFGQRIKAELALLFAAREAARVRKGKNVYQPKTIETKYRMSVRDLVAGLLEGKDLKNLLNVDVAWLRDSVRVNLCGTMDRVNAKLLARKIRAYLKTKDDDLILVLDRLAGIEDEALKHLFKKIRRHHERLKVVFQDGTEAVRTALAAMPQDLAALLAPTA